MQENKTDRGTILALGANSPIAIECLQVLAKQGYALRLACRSESKCQQAGQTLLNAGVSPDSLSYLTLQLPCSLSEVLSQLESIPDFAGLFCAVGVYALTQDIRADEEAQLDIVSLNFTALLPWLSMGARLLAQRGGGLIVVTGSVAGERGRGSNYAYGAAKAGLSAYLEGLRQDYFPKVRVIELRPGIIRTRMLEGRTVPRLLVAQPKSVGQGLKRALNFDLSIVYCPPYWYMIMALVRFIPLRLYRRLRL